MHLPAYAASGAVPPALEVAGIFFYFVPYRMLMVWVYDRTQSVLIAILMHLPLIVFLFNLLVPAMAAVPELIFNLVFGATLWVFVAAVAAANRRKLFRAEQTRATPLTHTLSEYLMTARYLGPHHHGEQPIRCLWWSRPVGHAGSHASHRWSTGKIVERTGLTSC